MPYNKIVVPLDGSKLAETVLPHVEMIAKGCSVPEVILVTVTEKVKGRTQIAEYSEQVPMKTLQSVQQSTILFSDRFFSGRMFEMNPNANVPVSIGKMAKTGHNYLSRMAEALIKKGIQTSIHVLSGDVAEEICYFSEEEGADLIIMASRGKTGLRRWDVANAAPKLFQITSVPVLLVKPPAGFKETKPVRKGKAV